MKELNILALSKAVPARARPALSAGSHAVNLLVRVSGSLTVGENYESRIAAKVPWELVALLLLSKVNSATRRAVIADALALDGLSVSKIKEEAVLAVAALKADTWTQCAGKVTAKLGVFEEGIQ